MKKVITLCVLLLAVENLLAQLYQYDAFYGQTGSNVRKVSFEKQRSSYYGSFSINKLGTPQENNPQSSLWIELGYILAMETVFTGMSYLASRKNGYGPAITGGFDIFMGSAGLLNAFHKELDIQTTGYILLSAGFFAKSIYNFHFNKNHNSKERFWTNFIGFNVLVFTGYFLDTLGETSANL